MDDNSGDEAFESADEDEFSIVAGRDRPWQPLTTTTTTASSAITDVDDGAVERCAVFEPKNAKPPPIHSAVDARRETCDATIATSKPTTLTSTPPSVTGVPASDSWSSWGSWGASIISSASKSVSQFSTEVTEGLNVLVDASVAGDWNEEDEEGKRKQGSKNVIEFQPVVDSPPLSSDQHPPEDPLCPTLPPTEFASTQGGQGTTTLSSITSSFFSSAPSFDAAAAAVGGGLSSAFGNFSPSSLPSAFSSLTTALSPTNSDAPSTTVPPAADSDSATADGAPGKTSSLANYVVEGGLGVLELVGRKTMDILKETDGGLETTRAIFDVERKGKPTLSDLLREGKTRREVEEVEKEEMIEEKKNSFQFWFDEYQGMAHLEALEMLSGQCETDIQDLIGHSPPRTLKADLITIKTLLLQNDDDDDEDDGAFSSAADHTVEIIRQVMRNHLDKVGASVSPDGFADTRQKASTVVEEFDRRIEATSTTSSRKEAAEDEEKDEVEKVFVPIDLPINQPIPTDIHRACIHSLGELVAKSIELFHKVGQMALVAPKSTLVVVGKDSTEQQPPIDRFVERLTHLGLLSKLLIAQVDSTAAAFSQTLSKLEGKNSEIEINQVITDIFLEASQGTDCVKSAFKLLLPIMQMTFLNHSMDSQ